MIRASQLISENDGYKVNHDVFDNLSDYTMNQVKEEYLEFLQDNADDFQLFDEFVCSWYENDPEAFKEMYPNWNEAEGEDYVPDGFEDEKAKEEYLEGMKEAFIDCMIESFNCGCPTFAFQDSSYYNMYVFVEPRSFKYRSGALSFFQGKSSAHLSVDYEFFENEEEEIDYFKEEIA